MNQFTQITIFTILLSLTQHLIYTKSEAQKSINNEAEIIQKTKEIQSMSSEFNDLIDQISRQNKAAMKKLSTKTNNYNSPFTKEGSVRTRDYTKLYGKSTTLNIIKRDNKSAQQRINAIDSINYFIDESTIQLYNRAIYLNNRITTLENEIKNIRNTNKKQPDGKIYDSKLFTDIVYSESNTIKPNTKVSICGIITNICRTNELESKFGRFKVEYDKIACYSNVDTVLSLPFSANVVATGVYITIDTEAARLIDCDFIVDVKKSDENPASEITRKSNILMEVAVKLIEEEYYHEAENTLKEALKIQKENNLSNQTIGNTISMLIHVLEKQGKISEAEKLNQQASEAFIPEKERKRLEARKAKEAAELQQQSRRTEAETARKAKPSGQRARKVQTGKEIPDDVPRMETIEDAEAYYDASKTGFLIAASPPLEPDGKIYSLSGILESSNPDYLVALIGECSATTECRFAFTINENVDKSKLRYSGMVNVVGKLVKVITYKTTTGSSRHMILLDTLCCK